MACLRPVLTGLFFAGVAAAAAHAQGLPQGPYNQTCRNPVMEGGVLIATCQRPDGGWRISSLALPDRCPGVIDNVGGWRKCLPGPAFGSSVSASRRQSPAAGR